MSTEYDLKERIKQLENEIKNLLEEQNHYLRVLNKRRQESLSIDNELQEVPMYLSNYIYKKIHSLSNENKDNLSSEILERHIQRAIDYLLKG
jgi:flagellar biosynthesis chaperone FliJ